MGAGDRGRRRWLSTLAAALAMGGAGAASSAEAAVIDTCTRAAVAAAIASGGAHTFACDGRIVMSPPLSVATQVSFDADGRDVTFAGSRPGADLPAYLDTRGIEARVAQVLFGGSLTLRGVDVEDGLLVTATGTAGRRGTDGAPGTNGSNLGDSGGNGGNGQADATAGAPAAAARGGCLLVEEGGTLILRDLAVRRCRAATGRAGAAGRFGGGGSGGRGALGMPGTEERAGVDAGDGGAGGDGGAAGRSAPPVDGVDNAHGEGGAIYSAGRLDLGGVTFEDNTVRGGDGGAGGDGAHGASGGWGGRGGAPGCTSCYRRQPRGGDGGAAGAPGASTAGADGGDAGAGHGGAVWAGGETSISGSRFARNTAQGGRAGAAGDGGSGGQSLFGETQGCYLHNNSVLVCPEDRIGKRGAPAAGTVGSDGGTAGDGGNAVGGAVFLSGRQPPPVNTVSDGNRVVPGVGEVDCQPGVYEPLCAYAGSGGQHLTHECIRRHEKDPVVRPPCERAGDGAPGRQGRDGTVADADIGSDQADGLSVSLSYPGDDVPGFRFPLEQAVTATVTVAVSGQAPGAITGIAFAEGAIVRETENDHLRVSGTDPPAPFTLAPGARRTFEVVVTGESRGSTALRVGVAGKDALGRTAEAALRDVVRVGEDIRVKLTVDPDELELDGEPDPATGRPPPKPLTLTVELENVADEDLTDVALDLRTTVRQLTGRDPLAPYPLQVRARLGEDGAPETPLTNAQAREIAVGALVDGAKKTLRFRAEAVDKAAVEVRPMATGTAAGPRTVIGLDEGLVRISQPRLLALTGDAPLHGAARSGQRWAFSGRVKNLSPDEEVTVFLRTTRRENVAEGQVSVLTEPDACGCGVARRLEPGESIPVYGSLVTSTKGGSRGLVEMDMTGKRHTYDSEGLPVDVPVSASEMVIAPGADRRTISIDRTDPPVPAFDLTEAAWLVSDSAARTLGERVTGAWATAGAAYDFMQTVDGTMLAVGMQQVLSFVREEAPEALERAREDLVRTLLAFDDQLDRGEALAIADEAFAKISIASVDAYNETTWQDASTATGRALSTYGPDLALEVALPGVAACALVKFGAKPAMLRRAAKLAESRPGRVLAKGRKGLKPGDEISALLARKLWGVDGVIDAQLLDYAQKRKLIIAVRDRSPGSIRRLAEGLLPKWEAVKAKNVSDLDVKWLGFHPSHLDTAMLKQMPDEASLVARLQQAGVDEDEYFQVLARFDQRRREWDGKDRRAMEAHETSGVIPKPSAEVGLNPTDNGIAADNVWVDVDYELLRAGQRGDRSGDLLAATTDGLPAYQPRAFENGRFRAMTGDMDPIAFLDENGRIPDVETRKQIYKDLAAMGFQHPESLTWDNAAGRAAYLFDFDLANGLSDALLVYAPDGTRRAGFFDSRKSRLDPASLPSAERGFMGILGAPLSFDAPGPTTGAVALPLRPETDPPRFLTPGGSRGAVLSDTPGTRLIRRNPDGTFSEWTPERGWQPYVLPTGETLTTLPQTAVRSDVAAGQSRIDISEQSALILRPGAQAWFKPGDLLVLDPGGPNEEFVTVSALGSIITTAPLTRPHVAGEMVAVVPRAAPPAAPAGGAPPAAAVLGATATAPARAAAAAAPGRSRPTTAASGVPGATLKAVRLASSSFRRRSGTRLRFTLDRATRVAVVLHRRVPGRRAGRSCSTRAKRGRRCTRSVPAGRRSLKGRAGSTSVAFGRGLKPGSYVAKLSVTGSKATVTVRFKVRA